MNLNFKWPFKRETPTAKATEQKLNVMVDLMRQNFDRFRKELDDWKEARDIRLDVDNPVTYYLQELYADTIIDAHLRSAMESRILRIVNRDFVIKDASGQIDEEKTKLISTPWFSDVVRHTMESIFFGYSLMYPDVIKDGRIQSIKVVPREHVIPEKGFIVKNVTDYDQGFPYQDMPDFFFYAQLYNAVGLLEVAAPLCILKRHSWGSWDEFEQMFGVPLRVAKVAGSNKAKKKEVSKWLNEMSSSGSAVLDLTDQIEVIQASQQDAYRVFLEKISSVNSEISKLINGQTMTSDDGSSKSQADVHLKTQNEITRADEREILFWLNFTLKPALQNLGYPIDDDESIGIFEKDSPEDRIKIDEPLLRNGYKLSDEYIEKTYGVELAKTEEPAPPKPTKGKPDDVEDFFG